MAKLYLFGIGGTGARVIRSLTMLLAAGVKCNATEIIPVLIDPDRENGDLRRTEKLLNKYCEIRRYQKEDKQTGEKKPALSFISSKDRLNAFFKMPILESDFGINEPKPGFVMPITIVNGDKQSFKSHIDYDNLSEETKALANMLFSQANLDLQLEFGFKGNPNIGSIVLNQFESKDSVLKKIFTSFQPNDRIFIVSSIFGGTGSSGFPLLLKTLRKNWAMDKNSELAFSENVRNACIGAVTVMPYFQISGGDSKTMVNSQTFISKTIAAMDYYHKDIIGKEKDQDTSSCLNYLYSIADYDHTKENERNEGGENQVNNAHFVELASALAICHFMNKNIVQNDSEKHITKKMRFGIDSQGETGEIIYSNLARDTLEALRKPLTQLWLFSRYIHEKGGSEFNGTPAGSLFESSFFSEDHGFYKIIKEFLKEFDNYLYEMEQTRSFVPYTSHKDEDIFLRIRGVGEKKKRFFAANETGWDLLITQLNKQREVLKGQYPEERFLEIFYRGTLNSMKERLTDW
ncbi:MAG: hypothetical protein LBC85_00920 [Fibromonadaceae bacterium]|jgi:hypothetical protein|nr:hypothetical protein [Fibromonadaceae bacterium]